MVLKVTDSLVANHKQKKIDIKVSIKNASKDRHKVTTDLIYGKVNCCDVTAS